MRRYRGREERRERECRREPDERAWRDRRAPLSRLAGGHVARGTARSERTADAAAGTRTHSIPHARRTRSASPAFRAGIATAARTPCSRIRRTASTPSPRADTICPPAADAAAVFGRIQHRPHRRGPGARVSARRAVSDAVRHLFRAVAGVLGAATSAQGGGRGRLAHQHVGVRNLHARRGMDRHRHRHRPARGSVLLGFCPLFAALYPLTQLYQVEEICVAAIARWPPPWALAEASPPPSAPRGVRSSCSPGRGSGQGGAPILRGSGAGRR